MSDSTTETKTTSPGDRLLLWHLARQGMPDAGVLSGLGITQAELTEFTRQHAEEFADLQRQALALSMFTRKSLGELILSQFLGQLVMAVSAGKAAVLLRVARQLPEWVLPASTAEELAELGGEALMGQVNRMREALEQPAMSRQQRRSQAAIERKASRNGKG